MWRLFKDATGIGYFLSARNLVRTRRRGRNAHKAAGHGKGFYAIASIVAVQGAMIGLLAAAVASMPVNAVSECARWG